MTYVSAKARSAMEREANHKQEVEQSFDLGSPWTGERREISAATKWVTAGGMLTAVAIFGDKIDLPSSARFASALGAATSFVTARCCQGSLAVEAQHNLLERVRV